MLYFLVTTGLLIWSGIQDIRHRSIHNAVLIAGAVLVGMLLIVDGLCEEGTANLILSHGVPWRNVWGVLPGAGLLFLSRVTNGSIGAGDGWLLCICGAALGLKMNLSLLFYALILAGGASVVLLVLKKVRKDTKLPFVPFLFGGYLLTLLQYV